MKVVKAGLTEQQGRLGILEEDDPLPNEGTGLMAAGGHPGEHRRSFTKLGKHGKQGEVVIEWDLNIDDSEDPDEREIGGSGYPGLAGLPGPRPGSEVVTECQKVSVEMIRILAPNTYPVPGVFRSYCLERVRGFVAIPQVNGLHQRYERLAATSVLSIVRQFRANATPCRLRIAIYEGPCSRLWDQRLPLV